MKNQWFSPKYHLRASGFIEGISFLVLLFIAMPLKYWADQPAAVRYTGMIHGLLFVWYIGSILWARLSLRLSFKGMVLGFLASLVPFGTFYADKRIFRYLKETNKR